MVNRDLAVQIRPSSLAYSRVFNKKWRGFPVNSEFIMRPSLFCDCGLGVGSALERGWINDISKVGVNRIVHVGRCVSK